MSLTDHRIIVASFVAGHPQDIADELRRMLAAQPTVDLPSLRLVEEETPGLWRWYGRIGTLTGECSSCHAHARQPHTEYCQLTLECGCPVDGMQSHGCFDPDRHHL